MFVGQKLGYYDGMITIKHGLKYLNNMKQTAVEMDKFLDKLYALCWEYHIEIKPTHPVPNDEYPTISIINGDEVVKLLYVDGDGENYYNETFKSE